MKWRKRRRSSGTSTVATTVSRSLNSKSNRPVTKIVMHHNKIIWWSINLNLIRRKMKNIMLIARWLNTRGTLQMTCLQISKRMKGAESTLTSFNQYLSKNNNPKRLNRCFCPYSEELHIKKSIFSIETIHRETLGYCIYLQSLIWSLIYLYI